MSGVFNVWCDECLVCSMSYFTHGVINVWCDQCLVWSMSFYTHSVINVWCGECLVWWISLVINVWCVQCPILHTVWSMSGVINVWCGQCPFLQTVWSMSGVINVCVINVVQSKWKKLGKKKTIKAWDQKVPKATKPSSQQNGANYPCCKTTRSVIKQTLLMNSIRPRRWSIFRVMRCRWFIFQQRCDIDSFWKGLTSSSFRLFFFTIGNDYFPIICSFWGPIILRLFTICPPISIIHTPAR